MPLLNIPIPTSEAVLFFYAILVRVMGLFTVAPLFSSKTLGPFVRVFLALFLSLNLSIIYQKNYLTTDTVQIFPHELFTPIGFILLSIKEFIIGYLIGFCFNLVLEALLLAGELIDNMVGFSTAQFLDPLSNQSQALIGTILLVVFGFVVLLEDWHLIFVIALLKSFFIIPLGNITLNPDAFPVLTAAASTLFFTGIKIAAIPALLLFCATVGIAFAVNSTPNMSLLWMGFPIRFWTALFALWIVSGQLFDLFGHAFQASSNLVESILPLLNIK